jgi:hypothetical protein
MLAPTIDAAAAKADRSSLWTTGYLVALHPALVQYSAELGLILAPGEQAADESPYAEKQTGRETYGPIRHESYAEHIQGLYTFYLRSQRERTAAARHKLEQQLGLPGGALERAIRLMFAVHDLGKLDATWQRWAHTWQARVAQLRREPHLAFASPDYMAAHTAYDSDNPQERAAQGEIQPKRPPHAAESARAARDLIAAIAEGNDSLHTALMHAIICHHSANFRGGHGSFTPARGAKAAFYEAMQRVNLFDDEALRASGARVAWRGFPAAEDLSEYEVDPAHPTELLLYLFLVRILRLADQGSQEIQ